MIVGLLSSLLSGASYGTELGDMESGPHPGEDGHLVIAIQVAAFEDVARFKARVDQAIRQLHTCRLAPGYDRVYAPGEKEFLTRESYRREGIPLNEVTLDNLRQTAHALGIEYQL
jgi:LDH2 family malate/lactate/ureidoglycolate dehydrogenase